MDSSSESHLRRLAVVLEDSNDAITVQKLDGTILAWNRGAQKMYGYTESEALKMNISSIVPDDKKEEALSYLDSIARGHKVESFETLRIKKDGSVIIVWLIITCLRNDKGQIDSIATTERDITQTKLELKKLRGLLPICANCKAIRNDAGYWQELETYVEGHSEAVFSHGLCPKCAEKFYGKQDWYIKMQQKKSQKE